MSPTNHSTKRRMAAAASTESEMVMPGERCQRPATHDPRKRVSGREDGQGNR